MGDRAQVVDMTYPHIIDTFTFTSPLPQTQTIVNLLEPFDTYVWILTMVSIALIMALIKLAIHCKLGQSRHGHLWIVYSSMFKLQMPTRIPCSMFNVAIFSPWLMACVLFTTCYAGGIYSVLTVPYETRIDTLYDLAQAYADGRIKVLVPDIDFYRNLFQVKSLKLKNCLLLNKLL